MVLACPKHKLMNIAHLSQAAPLSILFVVKMVLASTALLGRVVQVPRIVQKRLILMALVPQFAVLMVHAGSNAPCIRVALLLALLSCAPLRQSIALLRTVPPLVQGFKRYV
jgi:ABC-type Na+ efflux pump permease subunit